MWVIPELFNIETKNQKKQNKANVIDPIWTGNQCNSLILQGGALFYVFVYANHFLTWLIQWTKWLTLFLRR